MTSLGSLPSWRRRGLGCYGSKVGVGQGSRGMERPVLVSPSGNRTVAGLWCREPRLFAGLQPLCWLRFDTFERRRDGSTPIG